MDISQQAALTPIQASKYLGIDTSKDVLRESRATGLLWGIKSPKFVKAGARKIIYLKSDLDNFLNGLKKYDNNAQVDT